jgi:hypothetical protein
MVGLNCYIEKIPRFELEDKGSSQGICTTKLSNSGIFLTFTTTKLAGFMPYKLSATLSAHKSDVRTQPKSVWRV